MSKRCWWGLGLLFLVLLLAGQPLLAAQQPVFVLPVEGTIDRGLAGFLTRSYREAESAGASWVLLEVDTPGGLVDAAQDIRNTIRRSPVPTAVWVKGGAISAGALLALSADRLFMAPGTTIGAAEPRLGQEKADEKTVSWWAGELAGAAEEHGRDPTLARAMADRDVEIPGVKEKGKLLTLTSAEALRLGLADGLAGSRQEALELLGAAGPARELRPGAAEELARWVTSPYLAPLLLALGLGGLIVEVFTAGFGVAGAVGILALALYFGGHWLAGLTGWEGILLFLLGLILLAVEVLVIPGFGVTGIAGIGALVASIFLVSPDTGQAVASLVLGLLGAALLVGLSFRFLPSRRVWQRLVLGTREETAGGYVAPAPDLASYVGQEGRSITILRPAGTVEMPDGRRLDVVTEGQFIGPRRRVRVERVEGTRVVVREVAGQD